MEATTLSMSEISKECGRKSLWMLASLYFLEFESHGKISFLAVVSGAAFAASRKIALQFVIEDLDSSARSKQFTLISSSRSNAKGWSCGASAILGIFG
jgi:hypothetical protein